MYKKMYKKLRIGSVISGRKILKMIYDNGVVQNYMVRCMECKKEYVMSGSSFEKTKGCKKCKKNSFQLTISHYLPGRND